MEMNQEWHQAGNQLVVDDEMKKSLSTIASWTTFLSIVAFVMLTLTVICGVLMLVSSHVASEMDVYRSVYKDTQMILTVTGIAYIVIGLIFFIPASKLYGAASAVKKAISANDNESLAKAFSNWKFVSQFYGWVVIISLLLTVAACVYGITAASHIPYYG